MESSYGESTFDDAFINSDKQFEREHFVRDTLREVFSVLLAKKSAFFKFTFIATVFCH